MSTMTKSDTCNDQYPTAGPRRSVHCQRTSGHAGIHEAKDADGQTCKWLSSADQSTRTSPCNDLHFPTGADFPIRCNRASNHPGDHRGVDLDDWPWFWPVADDTMQRAAEALDRVEFSDGRTMHAQADGIVLNALPASVREAYVRVMERAPGWHHE